MTYYMAEFYQRVGEHGGESFDTYQDALRYAEGYVIDDDTWYVGISGPITDTIVYTTVKYYNRIKTLLGCDNAYLLALHGAWLRQRGINV